MPVTPSRKRYVVACAACDGLFDASRADQITCSTACRVQLHRHPELIASTREWAQFFQISVALIRRAHAIERLRPDLAQAVEAGTRTSDDVQPEIYQAYLELLAETLAPARQEAQPTP